MRGRGRHRRRGNPRNAPWGMSTERERVNPRHMGKRRISGGDGSSGILLGSLTELEIRKGDGEERVVKPKGAYLAWIPTSKTLAIVYKVKGAPSSRNLPESVRRAHQVFHNAPPKAAVQYKWPDPVGTKRTIGYVKTITYTVPASISSPSKRGYRWVHAFGDHGESGHGPLGRPKQYPQSLMPALQVDSAGNAYITRRPGNKFKVTDWIYW